jgi:hypothetical protein
VWPTSNAPGPGLAVPARHGVAFGNGQNSCGDADAGRRGLVDYVLARIVSAIQEATMVAMDWIISGAFVALMIWLNDRHRRHLRNGEWHHDGFQMRRFVAGKWQHRSMTAAEIEADREDRDNWAI